MGEVLAMGLTHYPALVHPDEHMAGILRWTLQDEAIPAAERDPAAWPAAMREEYGEDGGTASAARHRAACVENFRKLRAQLDAFGPDVLVIWGDDQYENFREEIIPPFCLFAQDGMKLKPWAHIGADNVWNEPADPVLEVTGAKQIGKHLATAMLDGGVDLSYAYQLRDPETLPHAFLNSILFLDYDRVGFPYPVIPFQVNCYGSYVIARHGEPARLGVAEDPSELDPPGPTPQRAMQVGAAFARAALASPYRVAVIGSSSWSHAFLHDKAWRLYADIESDLKFFEALKNSDYGYWARATTADLNASGQQEMLNWFCLMGAAQELGAKPVYTDLITTYTFNSSKAFAIFK